MLRIAIKSPGKHCLLSYSGINEVNTAEESVGFFGNDLLNYLLKDDVLSADSHDNSKYIFSFNKGKLLCSCPHVAGNSLVLEIIVYEID